MRVCDAAATSGPAAHELRTFCGHPAVASLRGFIDLLTELPCRTLCPGHPLAHCALPSCRGTVAGHPLANCAEPGPRPRLASKGDAPGHGKALASCRQRPSLESDGPAQRRGSAASPARNVPDPAFAQRRRAPPGPPRPRRTPAPSRRARGPPTAKGTLSAGEGQGGGRQLRVASSAGALTASQVTRALRDDAANCGFAVWSRDRACWDH